MITTQFAITTLALALLALVLTYVLVLIVHKRDSWLVVYAFNLGVASFGFLLLSGTVFKLFSVLWYVCAGAIIIFAVAEYCVHRWGHRPPRWGYQTFT